MEITFAGVGGAFCGKEQYQSNMVLTASRNRRILFDCGTDARHSLAELGVTNYNVGDWLEGVYISHLHADHCGGLEWLGFCTALNGKKVKLFISENLIDPLWDTLKGGMQFFKYGKQFSSLSDYFDVQSLKDEFWWAGNKFTLVRGDHINDGSRDMLVHGLFIECLSSSSGEGFNSERKIFITADGNLNYQPIYHYADMIIQDTETYDQKSGVHAHYDELIKLPSPVRRKMWLYHYSPDPKQQPEQDGFLGFAKKGQTIVV